MGNVGRFVSGRPWGGHSMGAEVAPQEPGERLHFKEALRWRSGRGVPGALDGSGAGSEWVSKAG